MEPVVLAARITMRVEILAGQDHLGLPLENRTMVEHLVAGQPVLKHHTTGTQQEILVGALFSLVGIQQVALVLFALSGVLGVPIHLQPLTYDHSC